MNYHATFGSAGVEKIGDRLVRKKNLVRSSEDIAKQTADFLANNGKVQYIKQGVSGIKSPVKFL